MSITPLPAKELNELFAAFLLNLSITTLPAKELNELFAAFLTEFVYYSLTSCSWPVVGDELGISSSDQPSISLKGNFYLEWRSLSQFFFSIKCNSFSSQKNKKYHFF